MKYIFLCCLFLSSTYMPAQLGEEKLEKLVRDNFGVSATPENILKARTPEGESVLHIVLREVVKAPNNQEIGCLAEAQGQIEDKVIHELISAVDQEGHSLFHFAIKIARENAHAHAIEKLDTFCSIEQIHRNIRRPRAPCEGCSLQRRVLWAAGTAVGTAVGILIIAYKLDFQPIRIIWGTDNNPA